MGQDQDSPVVEVLGDKEPYKAYAEDRIHPRNPGEFHDLAIINRGQVMDVLVYSYILRMRYSMPDTLSLVCVDCVFTMTGQTLDKVNDLIRNRRLAEIQVYNPLYHRKPPPGVPVIEQVSISPRSSTPQK